MMATAILAPAPSATKGKETAMKSSRAGRQHEAPLESPYPSQDWTQIEAKTTVEVRYPSGYSYQAIVDEKSPDSRIVWVLSIDGHGRKMYGNWEGVQLWNGVAVRMLPKRALDDGPEAIESTQEVMS
jgi:hypothetical protein